MVSSLRKCATYDDMKAEPHAEITFLKDFGPDIGKTAHAHVVDEHAITADDEPTSAEDDSEEGTIELDLS